MMSQPEGSSTPGRWQAVEDWFSPRRFAALLGILIVALFPDVLLGLRTFVFRDFSLYSYPVAFYHREAFWRGELPLWNPLSQCGVPFMAQWSTMVFYPLTLFYLLLPLSWSLGVFCLLHLFWGGLGMYFLARRWSGSQLGAVVAGLAFTFNGMMLNSVQWPHYTVVLGWMPFVLLTVEDAWRVGGRKVLLAALAGTMQMLAGMPEIILLTWLLLTAMLAGECRLGRLPRAVIVRRFAGVVMLVAGLAAVQLLPFLDFLRHSHRGSHFGGSDWSMPAWGWLNLFVPLFQCRPTSIGVYFQNQQAMTTSYYLGAGVLVLALTSVVLVRRRRVWLLAVAAVLSVLVSLGEHARLFTWLQETVPVLGFTRYPIKFFFVAMTAIPLLAAFAVRELIAPAPVDQADFGTPEPGNGRESLGIPLTGPAGTLSPSEGERDGVRGPPSMTPFPSKKIDEAGCPRFWRAVVALTVVSWAMIGLAVAISRGWPTPKENWTVTLQNGLARGVFLLLALALLYGLHRAVQRRAQVLLAFGFVIVLWLDLATHVPAQNPTTAGSVYTPNLPILQDLQPLPRAGESRAMPTVASLMNFSGYFLPDPFKMYLLLRIGLSDNCNLLDGIPKPDGFFSLSLKEQREVLPLCYVSTNAVRPALADFLGVSQITSRTNLFAWEARANYLPLITGGQKPEFLDATNTLSALAGTNFNPRTTVYLPPEARSWTSVTNAARVQVTPGSFSAQRIECDVDAASTALVVIAQAYYHPWHAYVDGQPARLLRANHAFQAIEVPAGRHHLKLAYEDRAFHIGSVISLVTLLGMAGAWWGGRRARGANRTKSIG